MASIQISTLLKPEQIKLQLQSNKRAEAINEVAQLLANNPNVINYQGFYDDLLARERLESTCLGNEIAFPHARTDHLKGMVMAVGRSPGGILFETSGETVRLIFVIGTPKPMATDYLSVVGGLARMLKEVSLREELLSVTKPEDFISRIIEASAARV